jgi:hypothetical protein
LLSFIMMSGLLPSLAIRVINIIMPDNLATTCVCPLLLQHPQCPNILLSFIVMSGLLPSLAIRVINII